MVRVVGSFLWVSLCTLGRPKDRPGLKESVKTAVVFKGLLEWDQWKKNH